MANKTTETAPAGLTPIIFHGRPLRGDNVIVDEICVTLDGAALASWTPAGDADVGFESMEKQPTVSSASPSPDRRSRRGRRPRPH